MTTIHPASTALTPATAHPSAAPAASTANQPPPTTAAPSQSSGGDKLTLSGHAMLLSRLFHTDDPNARPPVETSFGTHNLSGNSGGFLKMEDRKLIERAYEYASANGMDLEQVDCLAAHLSSYRFLQVTGNNTGEVTGAYDLEGNPWVGKLNAHDAELAKRMLTSQAIEETDLDKDFLAFMLNPQRPGKGASGLALSFESLETFISALSPSGGAAAQPADSAAAEPRTPSNAALAQALYRIDHPYVGSKWPTAQPQNDDSRPLQHLSAGERRQLLAAYQLALLQGSATDLKSLDRLSSLAGIAKMQQEGAFNSGNPLSPASLEHLGRLLQALAQPDTDAAGLGFAQGLLPIKPPHIDTSA